MDAPVDSSAVNRSVHVEFDRLCRAPGVVRLRLEEQRPITADGSLGLPRGRRLGPRPRGGSAAPCAAARAPARRCRAAAAVISSSPRRSTTAAAPRRSAGSSPPTARFRLIAGALQLGRDVLPHRTADGAASARRCAAPRCCAGPVDPARREVLDRRHGGRPRRLGARGRAEAADRLRSGRGPAELTDAFGQRLSGNPVATMSTTGYAPAIDYPSGRALVERRGGRTFGVTYVNVDTLEVLVVADSRLARGGLPRPQRVELARALAVAAAPAPSAAASRCAASATGCGSTASRRPPAPAGAAPGADGGAGHQRAARFGEPHLPPHRAGAGERPGRARAGGTEDAAVWVTGAEDGRPRSGAAVTLHDARGRVLAGRSTDSTGLARLAALR